MARGGRRNRSGPLPDPNSERSERRKYVLTALPVEGPSDPAPKFPLPQVPVYRKVEDPDGVVSQEIDKAATARRKRREIALWEWAWTTPQACAWHMEPWRHHTVAMWVRTAVICESAFATAADKNSLHRFADQIGLTPAGLAENGWKIASEPVSLQAVADVPEVPVQRRRSRELGA